MEWKCIGFDLRVWPRQEHLSVDAGEWDLADQAIADAVQCFALIENDYQLMSFSSESQIAELERFACARSDCNLIAIDIPKEVADFRAIHFGLEANTVVVPTDWGRCIGIDVCDIDGLFSVLHHPYLMALRGHRALFPLTDLHAALECVQLANFVDRGHSPLSVARMRSLK